MNTNSTIGDLPAGYKAALWDANRDTWGMPGQPCRGYYELLLYVPPEWPGLLDRYRAAAAKHNCAVMAYIAGADVACDSGFDLFVPVTQVLTGGESKATLINHRIKCCMRKVKGGSRVRLERTDGKIALLSSPPGRLVGYTLYPRSSMATKTPLRLANSVGVIDAGYRGDIQAAVDVVHAGPEAGGVVSFTATEGMRLVQICPSALSHPVYVRVTDNPAMLGSSERGAGGFGSTGESGQKGS